MRQQDKIIVWSAYFDVTKTRADGRRLLRSLSVSLPRTSEIKEAAEKVGYECELVADSGYSKTPWLKTGMLLVKKKGPKDQMLKRIAKQLQKDRSVQSPQSKG